MSITSTKTQELELHPLAEFPLLPDKEFAGLVDDIKANGLLDPIMLYQGKVLDGCHRYKACLKAGIEPRFEEFKGDDAAATAFVVSKNIRRRHLTAKQKRELIAKLLKEDPSKSDRQIAKTAKASPTYVGKVRAEKEATGDVSTVDTRTDTRGRKQPAKKTTKAARKQKARERRKIIGKDGKTRRRPAKKAKPKISKASSKLANLVIDTVLPKVEAGKTAATSADDAAACDLDLAEQLQAAKIKIAGLESEVEELKAENAELRAKLEAAACTPAGVPPENGERPASPSTNGKGKFDKHIIEDPEQPGMFRVKRPDGTVTIPVTHGRAQFVAEQLWG